MLLQLRRFTTFFALLFLVMPARAEVIRAMNTDVHLNADTSITVAETIQMDFENSQRHGLRRIIPVRYQRSGGAYSLYLDVLSVTDENNAPLHFETSHSGDDLTIKIGDADRTVTGQHTYKLLYSVRRAVNFFGGAPEVYWNATGNEWVFPIQQASARFFPPPNVQLSQIRTQSFIGPPGATTPAQTLVAADCITFSATNLNPGSGLTFVAGLPQNSVTPPTMLQNLLWFLADWWPLIVFPLLALGFVGAKYLQGGRDAGGGLAAGVEWNPPQDLTPAEAGTLLDERCDMQDIVSTLVDLAARGYLKIEELQSDKFLFFSSKDYRFTKNPQAPPDSALLPHEKEFYNGLFGVSDIALLTDLKNHFYTHLPTIKSAVYQELMDKKLFTSNPETTRGAYTSAGFILIFAGVCAAVYGAKWGLSAYGAGIAAAGIWPWFFARAMPAKTALGSQKLRECLGFQRFVKMAEKERIRVLAQNDPTIFGRLLPYAMVLGVADQWADNFQGLLSQPPDWYVPYGYGPNYNFSSRGFVHDLGGGMNTMGQTFASAPSSSAGSGGSGFSGGGSGGGFGGGGGGSW